MTYMKVENGIEVELACDQGVDCYRVGKGRQGRNLLKVKNEGDALLLIHSLKTDTSALK